MARDIFLNGESLVTVRGSSSSLISSVQELGLAVGPIRITPNYMHQPINVDAWGQAPMDMQFMLETANISMTLVHFDRTILASCLAESKGGALTEGQLTRAGTRLGSNNTLYSAGCHFISLGITSPVGGLPWRFFTTFMTGPPMEFPLGVERALVVTNWLAIPGVGDPWQGGLGAAGAYIFDHVTLS